MANFMGGSAPAMAHQVVDGYLLLSLASLRGFLPADLQLLRAELDKHLREVRASSVAQDDAVANQARNRKIARISSAMQVLQGKLQAR
jgi:hypothetical protein